VASSVAFTGTEQVGETLTRTYSYSDADGDSEGSSTTQWYRADDGSETNEAAISGATSSTYTLVSADEGKFIRVGVVPVAATGTSPGAEAFSSYSGAIAAETAFNAAIVTWEEPVGTDAGDFNSGARRSFSFNTVKYDPDGLFSLSGGGVVFPAGSYRIRCALRANRVDAFVVWANNGTSDVGEFAGYARQSAAKRTISDGWVDLSFGSTTTLNFEAQCELSKATDGFGVNGGIDTNIYATLDIEVLP